MLATHNLVAAGPHAMNSARVPAQTFTPVASQPCVPGNPATRISMPVPVGTMPLPTLAGLQSAQLPAKHTGVRCQAPVMPASTSSGVNMVITTPTTGVAAAAKPPLVVATGGTDKSSTTTAWVSNEIRMLSLELKFDGDFTLVRVNGNTRQMEDVPLLLQPDHPTNSGATGLRVWDAGITMAKYAEGLLIQGLASGGRRPRILELGCGTAVAGLSAALLGCDVVVTDCNVVRDRTEQNILLNAPSIRAGGGSCKFAELDWNALPANPEDKLGTLAFDAIWATDVIWAPSLIDPFLRALRYCTNLCQPKPSIVMAHKMRDENTDILFKQALAKAGFRLLRETPASQFITDSKYLNPKVMIQEVQP